MTTATPRTGIYAGTFDPITLGHIDIITRSLSLVDRLVIGVAEDTGKHPIFEADVRADIVREDIMNLGKHVSDRITVLPFAGLLVNFAKAQGATLLIRGLRAVSDFEYEFQMSCMNHKLASSIETIFLTASESTHFVSSRFVKQIAQLGGDISGLVSPQVQQKLQNYYGV
jgi:pantetheine-phosphate adenylyltransferase